MSLWAPSNWQEVVAEEVVTQVVHPAVLMLPDSWAGVLEVTWPTAVMKYAAGQ